MEKMREEVARMFPQHKLTTFEGYISIVRSELKLIENVNGLLRPNDRGAALLNTGNVDVLRHYLLKRVLGFDRILWELAHGAKTRRQLTAALRDSNPN